MSSRTLNRKDFLVLTISSATIASFLEACSSDPATTTTTGGSAGTGGSAAGTGGSAAGTATTGGSASGSGGTGGSAAGTSGSGTGGSGGTAGGSGGSSGGGAGSGGGGAGGTSGAAGHGGGGAGGGGGTGGGGGGMCGTVSIMQTSNEMHDHIPDDPTMLKADLKMLINGSMSTMAFTLPMDGPAPGHTHKITLTMAEVMTLKGGGMITGKMSTKDENHTHTYTIGCTA